MPALTLKIRSLAVAKLCLGILALSSAPVSAQAISDHNLAAASVIERPGCSILRIDFYGRVQMHSHFPASMGEELRVMLKLLDRPAGGADIKPGSVSDVKKIDAKPGMRREQARAPASERAAISNIELENAGIDQTLNVYFRHAVAYRVAPGKDPRTLVIAIAGRAPNAACEPVLDDVGNAVASGVPRTAGQPGGALDADIAEARAAMAKSDLDRAIAYLTRVTEAGPSKVLPEALELLGVAREKHGHLAHARADYQSYLKQFPTGEGSARIQKRMAALEKRMNESQAQPVALPSTPSLATKLDGKSGGAASAEGAARHGVSKVIAPAGSPTPNAWTVQHSGSISSFYQLNQGGRDFFVRPTLQQGWEKENIYQTYRNSLLSSGDFESSASNAFYAARVHMSASQEHRFNDGRDEFRISSLNVEGKLKESGGSFRVGRQTHYGGGILGRFDGGIATLPVADAWKLRLYAGSPVERSSDLPFLYDRAFYGASADYRINKALDISAYVIEQTSEKFTDRRAVGGEARYIDDTRHGLGMIDYDVYFNEINSVLGTGTVNFSDKSSLTGTLDYRRSPTMFTTSALQGQMETSLKDLLRRYSMSEIEDLARDRTPKSTVASVAYSRYLKENLQITGDLTVTNMSSMPESGGVSATPSMGWDTYTMLQVMATDVFRTNDTVTGSYRFATTASANRSLIEGSIRLPMSDENWRIGPMLRVGYAAYKHEPIKEYIVHPMLRTSYNLTRNLLMELEIGKRWTLRDGVRGRENETEFLLLSGLRYDFHTNR